MSASATPSPISSTKSTPSSWRKRPLLPLSVCFLALLTLTDRYFPQILWPSIDPKASFSVPAVHEGRVIGFPRPYEDGKKLVVATSHGKVLLTLEGGAGASVGRGDTVRFFGKLKKPARYRNPGSFDYRRYLQRQGILFTAYVARDDEIAILKTGSGLLRAVDAWRAKLSARLRASIPGDAGALMAALIVGDESGIDDDMRAAFRDTGTAHVIAVSGQHIGMVGAASFFLLYWLFRRSERLLMRVSVRALAAMASLAPIGFYVLLAGSPPSAVRAALLAVALALAVGLHREPDGLSALGAAALVIGAADPASVFSASFQLSFLAVLGIFLFRKPVGTEKNPWRIRFVENPLWMTLGATLFTAPLVAYRFHDLSLSGLLINLAAIPATGLLLLLGFGGALGVLAWPVFGLWILKAGAWAADFFLLGLRHAATWSREAGLTLSFYPSEAECLAGFALVAGLAWARLHPGKFAIRSVVLLSLAVIALAYVERPRRDLEVVFLDVGQGDSALVLTPSGKSLLVDAGGFLIPGRPMRPGRFEVGRDVVVPYLKRRGLKKIDAVLLSHPHPDHFGGLQAVFENFPVGEFWWNGQGFPDATFGRLIEAAKGRGSIFKILKDGDSFVWSDVFIEVIYPWKVDRGRSINDNSLVVRLAFGGRSILFSGDIEREGERALADLRDIRADVLKIPHHASRTSSSVPFIDSVKPSVAVASLGEDNLFGFPHEGILEKYLRRDVKVYRTDRDGAVTIKLSPELPRK